jgi:hypothetical protein
MTIGIIATFVSSSIYPLIYYLHGEVAALFVDYKVNEQLHSTTISSYKSLSFSNSSCNFFLIF